MAAGKNVHIGESPLKSSPEHALALKIKDLTIDTRHLKDHAVTMEKLSQALRERLETIGVLNADLGGIQERLKQLDAISSQIQQLVGELERLDERVKEQGEVHIQVDTQLDAASANPVSNKVIADALSRYLTVEDALKTYISQPLKTLNGEPLTGSGDLRGLVAEIAGEVSPEVDLSGYATETQVQELIGTALEGFQPASTVNLDLRDSTEAQAGADRLVLTLHRDGDGDPMTQVILPAATTIKAGLLSAADKEKLDGVKGYVDSRFVYLTEEEYNSMEEHDPHTYYFISDGRTPAVPTDPNE